MMSREDAEREAVKRERHKSKHLTQKRWEAVHTPTKGWHVALVDNFPVIEAAAKERARRALRSGDMRAFMDAAEDALMARVGAYVTASCDRSGEAGETGTGSTEGESAVAAKPADAQKEVP